MSKIQPGTIVAVDFDGTCVTHEYPEVGLSIGAQSVLTKIVKHGGQLILWTMRNGKHLQDAIGWFKENDIPLFGIQRNPDQDTWTDSPKAYAHIYIDDAALGCPLTTQLGTQSPFVDWTEVYKLLWPEDPTFKELLK